MRVYLSLGSNVGNREQTIECAKQELRKRVGTLVDCSSFFYSMPVGFDSPNEFCNIALSLDTDLSPLDLLHRTQEIERLLGRTRKSIRTDNQGVVTFDYSDRPIDIDILYYGDMEIHTPELDIPHPRMMERNFVLIPLSEIKREE